MSNSANKVVNFRERVTPKWSSFAPLLLIWPTFWLTFAPINALAGATSGTAVTIGAVWLMVANSPLIEVTDDTLRVGKAVIERKFMGVVQSIDKQDQFAEKGPKLDARAYLQIRGNVDGLVKIQIQDQKDPTPYWLVSSKRPEQLVAALQDNRPKA